MDRTIKRVRGHVRRTLLTISSPGKPHSLGFQPRLRSKTAWLLPMTPLTAVHLRLTCPHPPPSREERLIRILNLPITNRQLLRWFIKPLAKIFFCISNISMKKISIESLETRQLCTAADTSESSLFGCMVVGGIGIIAVVSSGFLLLKFPVSDDIATKFLEEHALC